MVVSNPTTTAEVEEAAKSVGQQQLPVVVEKKPFVIDMQEESVIIHPTIAPTTKSVPEIDAQAEVEITVQEHDVLAQAQSKMQDMVARIKAPGMQLQSIDALIDRREDQQQLTGDSNAALADSSKVDYCKGNVDPFEGQSIEHFKPPASATFDKVRVTEHMEF